MSGGRLQPCFSLSRETTVAILATTRPTSLPTPHQHKPNPNRPSHKRAQPLAPQHGSTSNIAVITLQLISREPNRHRVGPTHLWKVVIVMDNTPGHIPPTATLCTYTEKSWNWLDNKNYYNYLVPLLRRMDHQKPGTPRFRPADPPTCPSGASTVQNSCFVQTKIQMHSLRPSSVVPPIPRRSL